MSNHFDVIVLGLGAMGSATLYHVARRGRRVLGLEQFGLAHSLGSSHGKSRVIRQAYFEHPDYVPLLMRSYELWRELEQESGRELLLLTGGLFVGRPEAEVVAGSIASARKHGLPHQILDAADIRRRFPAFHVRPDEIALYEDAAGVLFPEDCITAQVELARRHGAEARFGVRVSGFEAAADGSGVRVETAEGVYSAERLVITAGPWAGEVLALQGLPLSVSRQVLLWLDANGPAEMFAPNRFPVFIWETPHRRPFYGFPNLRGQGVKVAFHGGGEVTTADTVRRTVSREEVEELRDYLAELMPEFHGPLREAAVCMYTNTPDAHFVIGLYPGRPQVSLAAGFSGHGFKMSSVVGEIMADLALDGQTRHPIGLFDPLRFR